VMACSVGIPCPLYPLRVGGNAHCRAGSLWTAHATIAGMTAVGAAVALTVTMAEMLPDPRRPERRAVDAAVRAVRDYADSTPGPDSRPLHRAAAHALAAAEEAMVEGYWRPHPALTDRLTTARRDYDRRARRATEYFLPAEDLAWDPHNPDAGRWLDESEEPAGVDMPSAPAAEQAGRAIAADERRHVASLRRRLADGLRYPGEPWSVALSVGVATTASILLVLVVLGTDQTHLYWVIA